MKKDLSSLEIRQLVKEFQFLVNGRIEKVYQPSKKEFVFKIHVTGGSRFLRINDKFVYLSDEKGDVPDKPTTFCSIMRKNLENSKIKSISQKESERIIIFEFESYLLIFELFGQTNLILCDPKQVIINANRTSRELRKGEKYDFPDKIINSFKLSQKEFADIVSSSELAIVKKLARLIGGTYAEEICMRSGIDKNATKIEDTRSLYSEYKKLLDDEISPSVVFNDKGVVDAVLFELKIYKENNKVMFSNFYEAVESFVSQMSDIVKESNAELKYNDQIDKIRKIIEKQKQTIKKLNKESEAHQREGELVYENYPQVEKALEEARKQKKQKFEVELK